MQEVQEMWVWSLCQGDPLEKEIATCSSILSWKISWTQEPGPWGCKELVMTEHTHTHTNAYAYMCTFFYMYVCTKSLQLCPTFVTLVCRAPLSMGLSQQEYWSGLTCSAAATLLQSCPTLCGPMAAAHQAPLSTGFSSKNTGVGCDFLLLAMSYSRAFSQPRDRTHDSNISFTGRWILYH